MSHFALLYPTRQLESVALTNRDFLSLEFWYTEYVRPDTEVKCYLWCTSDGSLPQYQQPRTDISQALGNFKASNDTLPGCHKCWYPDCTCDAAVFIQENSDIKFTIINFPVLFAPHKQYCF